MARKPLDKLFEDIGALLEIKGENPFKSRAYFNAARILSAVDNLDELIAGKRLREIRGIGEALAKKIEEYGQTGTIAYYDELTAEMPAGLLELLQVPNLGPKKIKTLFDRLVITNLGELEYACRENRLTSLAGFGEATQARILKGIEFLKKHKGEFLFGDVSGQAEAILGRLGDRFGPRSVEICGSIRRKKETVRDIDVLVAHGRAEEVSQAFISMPEVEEVLLTGETKTSCRLATGVEADLRVVAADEFPFALAYFTGSKEHNVRLRGVARRFGWKLNEYGLFEETKRIAAGSEAELYRLLGMDFIPPELREDMGEIEAAEGGRLPRLIDVSDIKGVFHVHSDFSDGLEPVERIVEAAKRLGLSYVGISDHSQSASYAGGLNRDDVLRQWELIDRINSRQDGFTVFRGIESDVRPDGSLDYDDDFLEGFDFVIASVHSNFRMEREEMEARIFRALDNPYTTMLGHPTGRLLLSREGFDISMQAVIERARATGTMLELNASPYRFDVDWRYLKFAKEMGVIISINPDAHTSAGLGDYRLGVGIARKGWQEKSDVLNTRDANDIKDMFKGLRDGKRNRPDH
jgi:DNA polymerase (family 10)